MNAMRPVSSKFNAWAEANPIVFTLLVFSAFMLLALAFPLLKRHGRDLIPLEPALCGFFGWLLGSAFRRLIRRPRKG